TARGQVNLRNACHKDDPRPLEEGCQCPACRSYSRAYLHHVVKADEIIGSMLLTWHNLHYYQVLMQGLRDAVAGGRLAAFVAGFHATRADGDVDPR
ncbi:MAG TPA: tRNA-guanine transglycosylase, partial [Tabrizicola sp.]|nr:tRNA-guanine transglycosylase [Tabrizicola sp.]